VRWCGREVWGGRWPILAGTRNSQKTFFLLALYEKNIIRDLILAHTPRLKHALRSDSSCVDYPFRVSIGCSSPQKRGLGSWLGLSSRKVELVMAYEGMKITSGHHDYQLVVKLKNSGQNEN
jgi:hypothetical protein